MKQTLRINRRRWQIPVAGAAVLVAAFVVFPRGPNEPVYQGKALTQWIAEAHDVGIFDQSEETDAAMRGMGVNAAPFLLNEFTRSVHLWRDRLYSWISRHSPFKIHLRTDEERVRLAGNGLILLETNAAPALPVLARYLDDPIRDVFVIDILASQGDAALPYLTAGLASTNAVTITNVVCTLQRMAHRSISAREALAAALRHPFLATRAARGENEVDIVP